VGALAVRVRFPPAVSASLGRTPVLQQQEASRIGFESTAADVAVEIRSATGNDADRAARLWPLSEQLVGAKFC